MMNLVLIFFSRVLVSKIELFASSFKIFDFKLNCAAFFNCSSTIESLSSYSKSRIISSAFSAYSWDSSVLSLATLATKIFCCFIFFASKSYSQPITLYHQHNGRYNYKAIGNTLNTSENGAFTSCNILTGSSASLNIDSNQTVIAAYLYWAGSGDGDFDINLNDTAITPDRTFYF